MFLAESMTVSELAPLIVLTGAFVLFLLCWGFKNAIVLIYRTIHTHGAIDQQVAINKNKTPVVYLQEQANGTKKWVRNA